MLGRSLRAARARPASAAAAPSCTKFLRVTGMALHHELESELQAARIAGAGDCRRAQRVDVGGRLSKRRRVGEVERLGAELQTAAFAQWKALSEGQIEI